MLFLREKHQENCQENNCVAIFFINGAMCYEIRDAVAKIMGSSRGILEYSE